jgi:hypothetical protein
VPPAHRVLVEPLEGLLVRGEPRHAAQVEGVAEEGMNRVILPFAGEISYLCFTGSQK